MKNRWFYFLVFLVCAVSFFFIQKQYLFKDYHAGERDPDAKYDKPYQAEKYFVDQRTYPNGSVPDGWYEKAMKQVAVMQKHSLQKTMGGWTWIPVGPTNIAGRIRAVLVDPRNPQTVYIGSAGGGIWKSTNEGVTWRAMSDFLPNLRINCIAMHPTNSNILLAGNGEGWVYWQGGYMYGKGIYRTDDTGETWYPIPSTVQPGDKKFEYVFDVTFDPFNPTTILAATNNGIYRSTDDGTTWARRYPTVSSRRALQIIFSKTVQGLAYAAMNEMGVYKSTDAGLSWADISTGKINASNFDRIQIAVAPSNSNIVIASYIDAGSSETCIGVWKTTDGGTNWTKISTPTNEWTNDTYVGAQGSYNNILAFHPTDPNKVFAGGIDIYQSNNGGNAWGRISNAYTPSSLPFVHPDHHAIAFNPVNPRIMYFGHDGGIDRTANGGGGFEPRTTGLSITQFHSVAPHPTSDRVIGGTIDNGNLSMEQPGIFKDVTGGDGGQTIIDFVSPNYVYAEIYFLTFYRSTIGGASPGTFARAMSGIPPAPVGHPQYPGTSDRVSFFAPFQIDPNNNAILYAGTYRLYKTTDHADSWTPISGDLAAGGVITSIAISKPDSKVIYTGSNNSNMTVTTDGGSSWSTIRTGLPNRYVTDIAVDYSNPATAYVTFSGFQTGHIYRTSNYGNSWENISGIGTQALPDVPLNTVIIYPLHPNKIIVGSDVGAFETIDGGANWYPINSGMGNVTVADLRLRPDGTLFAATHGRGIFRSSYSLLDTQTLNRPVDFRLFQNFPNPFGAATLASSPGTFIRYQIGTKTNVVLQVYDVTGRFIRTLINSEHEPGQYTTEFDAQGHASGMYMYQLTAAGRSESKMMMLVK